MSTLPIREPDPLEPLLETSDELLPFEQLIWGGRKPPAEDDAVLAAARARAALLRGCEGPDGSDLVPLAFVSDLLGRLWLERPWSSDRIDRLVRRIGELVERPAATVRMSIFSRLIREQHLFELPPKLAIEAQLQMLASFSPLEEPSLWLAGSDSEAGRPFCALHVGEAPPGRRARAAAAEAIAKDDVATSERALIHAAPLRRWNEPRGAVVGKSQGESRREALAYLAEAALAVGPFLEIDNLLERNATHERALVESSERRLVRLGFDLHDGPMQDIAALAQDLRFFRSQLAPYVDTAPESDRLLGRVDDLDARLVTLDRDLRDLARSLDAPALSQMLLPDALAHVIGEFERRSGVQVEHSATGEFSDLTTSQRIAVLRVVQEALNNVHDHTQAKRARVRVVAGRAGLSAEIYDTGAGFDVEEQLVQAAKAGRLGLVGMSERMRLLGGKLEIDSKPGGPTRVFARIPRWQPLTSS
jgi:signal transduction histidine kinase